MKTSENLTTISYADLKSKYGAYSSIVPPTLYVLDTLRYEEIPDVLTQRQKDGNAFLEKTEVTSLVEWKLKHGTCRPNLAKLVASNSDKDVRETTKNAFEAYEANSDDYGKAISTLAKLKGIGPATASLLLACYDRENVPFFSDELYRYLHYEDAKSKGWDRKIGYTVKEYKSLVEKCKELRERVARGKDGGGMKAVEVEKAAYAICREAGSQKREMPSGEGNDTGDVLARPPTSKRRKTEKKKKKGGEPKKRDLRL